MLNTALAFLFALATVSGAHAASLSFAPASRVVSTGQEFSMDLWSSGLAAGAPSLGAFDIDVVFDPDVLSFISASYGTGLDVLGFGSLQTTTPGAGSVNLFELSLDRPDEIDALQPDSFLMATLTFRSTNSGKSPLHIEAIALSDAGGSGFTAHTVDAAVTVVPEPASEIVLVSAGLLLCAVYRWQKRIV